MDVRIEHLDVMRIWVPSDSHKCFLAPNMKETRKRAILESPIINGVLNLYSETSNNRIVSIMNLFIVKTLQRKII